MKCSEFIGALFLARNVAHSVHLNTRSYAKHKALNDFYDGIVGLADDFAEAYQGRYGLIGQIPVQAVKKTSNVTEFLQDQLDEIEKERYTIVKESDTALQNIIDEIVGLYLSTLYKMKFLS
jgi:DNA-binding ferritin-like protein